ncbi:PHD finger domain-containing protein [Hymenobacter coalescens]
MDSKQIQKLGNAFDSILRADYITLDKINELDKLEKYFIDYFGILQSMLQKQDNFISGRRGTGKTTNLLRGYYECLKTISPKFNDRIRLLDSKVLPIYIDLSTSTELLGNESNSSLIEVHFIRQIISSLKKQLKLMFDDKFLSYFINNNPALDDLEYIEKVLVEGIALYNQRQVIGTDKIKSNEIGEASAKIGKDPELNIKLSDSTEKEKTTSINQVRGLSAAEFLDKISEIKKKAGLDSIYVFIDEYSDLNNESQKKFSLLLKTLLGSRIGMYFKVGVITDRYDFGDKIIVGRDIFPIPLDFHDYVERYGGAIAAMTRMQEFVEKLIIKRIEIFCPELKYTDIFKVNKEQLFYRISRETLGVSRTIGITLQNALMQAQSSEGDKRIGLSEINYGITSARKTYQKQFQGGIRRKLLPGFYMDMWNDILKKAISEKNKSPERAASHILLDPIRKEYLNVLSENFLVHFISENVSSKHGGNYNLYAIDYDVCIEYNIKYADKKDDYTQIRFVYDSILSKYDPYFTDNRSKSYKCPKCQKIYNEDDVLKSKVKRCFDDDEKLEEIIHSDSPKTEGNYAEVEIKILGLISQLPIEEAMTAREVADAVGCTIQKVSIWGTRVLEKKGHIKIYKKGNKSYYYSNE